MIALADLSDLDRSVMEQAVYSLRNARVQPYPFPHFHAVGAFDWHYLDGTLLPAIDRLEYVPVEGKYAGRTFAKPDGIPGLAGFRTREFAQHVIHLFEPQYRARFGDEKVGLASDLRLVRDVEGYAIGPHTDAQWKLVSLLFYLRGDEGTSIYVPRDPSFRCPGGPHHDADGFIRIHTAPAIGCFGFWKQDNAFHGVEPLGPQVEPRDVLLYNLYIGRTESE